MNYQYLIIALVIIGSITVTSSAYAQDSNIPSWIKNTAGWWANDEVEDQAFFSLIEFLIEKEIITVSNNQDGYESDSQRVKELENQLSELKKQTVRDIQNAYDGGYSDGYADRPEVEQSMETKVEQTGTNEIIQDDEIFILINDSDKQQTFKKGDPIEFQFFVNVDEFVGSHFNLVAIPVLDDGVYGDRFATAEISLSVYGEGQYRDGWDGLPYGSDSCLVLCQVWISEIESGHILMGSETSSANILPDGSSVNTTLWEVQVFYGESSGSIRFLVEEF